MTEAAPSTPLLEQYEGVRGRYPGHLVLFRVGDFYETFGDDARLLSRELDVVLTARGPDARGDRVPMAGVPHHAIETYLGRLVRKGYKVALCDQVEDARLAQGLVRREVTRVVTPGTVVEDGILGGPEHSFLACVELPAAGPGTYSAVDVTTGEWLRGPADGPGADGLVSALAALQPREILWTADRGGAEALARELRREFPRARLEEAPAPAVVAELPAPLRADGGGAGVPTDLRLVAFLRATQPRLLPHVAPAERGAGGRRLVLDAKTLRHLEISRPMNPDDPSGATLLGSWGETVTPAGRRTLGFWLTNPLADVAAIEARQDAVAELVARGATVDRWRGRLREVADLGRIAARIVARRVRAEELVRLREGLAAAEALGGELRAEARAPMLRALAEDLEPPDGLLALLRTALPAGVEPGAASAADLLRPGYSDELDRLRAEEAAALAELGALERREQAGSGIKTLKIGYNQVFGHYFEVRRPNLPRVPAHFRRRQTIAQGERFVSDELIALADRIGAAREAARGTAEAVWEELLVRLDARAAALHRLARAVGALDVLLTFAYLAGRHRLVRPSVDGSAALVVRDGRHPVLEPLLGERFVPNDIDLDAASQRLLVLTGPNMSGKSTYMRQIGLLVVLAQAGSFVPARFARIGLVTSLFTRMGFTDEIGRAKSSFMVEMSEVAEILRRADPRSLVLLDEVGRGTSTFDGLALAWATLRHLHDVTGARTVLATHYHQLTELVAGLPAARNGHFAVQERPEGIVFLHRLVPGATDRSYGIHVARLAGVPADVLEEAERLLARLEAELPTAPSRAGRGRPRAPKPPRYTQAVLVDGAARDEPLAEELRRLDVAELSGDQAREKLLELRRRLAPPDGPPP